MNLWNKTSTATFVNPTTETNSDTAHVETHTDVSELILFYYVTYVSITIDFIMCPLGVAANVINIIVYWRQGIKDSVNITFISLSVWNLVICFLSCLSQILQAVEQFAPLAAVNLLSIQYVYFAYTKGFIAILTTFITVYLSVERCICIIFPFKVHEIFTAKRVFIVNVVLVIFGVACCSPVWATQGIQWKLYPNTNRTRLDLWLSDNRRDVELFGGIFNGMALPVLAHTFISISTWFMLQGISNSRKFRQRHTKQMEPERSQNCNEEMYPVPGGFRVNLFRSRITTSKDMKLTKVVLLLAMIFFICNLPIYIASFLRVLMPEIQVNRQQSKLHALLYSLVFEFSITNCAVNIFVYYNVSTRFRQEFLILFSRSTLIQNRIS